MLPERADHGPGCLPRITAVPLATVQGASGGAP